MTKEASAFRFQSLDGLRTLMVSYVMYHHFTLVLNSSLLQQKGLAQIFASAGFLGVRCFFIISGFLIFHQMKFRSNIDAKPKQQFYIRRFFRIVPLWWLVVLIYAALGWMPLTALWLNLTFLFGFVMFNPAWMPIPQSWSLFVEEFFYLFFPWLFRFLKTLRGSLVAFLISLVTVGLWRSFASELGVPNSNYFIEYFPFANLHYFFVGVLIYNFMQGPYLKPISDFWRKYLHYTFYQVALVLIFSALFMVFGLKWPFIFVIVFFIAALTQGSLLQKLCSFKPLRLLGHLSYSAYLLHFLVLMLMFPYVEKFGALELLIVFFTITFGLSAVTYVLVERPFLKLRTRF